MGLITGLVSTVVHVAAGRNPYGHNHNQAGQPVAVDSCGVPLDHADARGCTAGPNGQPCGICAVALPFGKGRQQKRERRAMRHAQRAQVYSNGRYPGYVPGGMVVRPQQQQQQQVSYMGGESSRQGAARMEEGVERRRASTGDDVPAPPPAYEETAPARRSVEVLGDSDEKWWEKA
ncbi:hypothetical protein CkaCkLH20_06647 [Colletotrichum karsti]|uniref:Uncharacterized protein n=1 Tax=Colletotrichum karsti TaxID=1095194 RepID=A0A9P6LK67_9PEZI|nr:uncharacterized protein CkaCkLH20_06647 [Colletotrichum karsti]KAF9875715.1 hypothetical protein CkaCkLH20_06647 [Colletotrichum karsti]